ncbi:hypothetical protein MIZ03_3961 [Rhodoferax lithotrophicus]|uniref:Uncharacterized protein n=1 Tax=Rhodoferax lithotrophicus TaxID=2798804 RepID=A0ABN6DAK8_9BURK|nr:hypothetical protein MIZ03_3961 [Rhodoferax sp. MIZ03]
MSMHAALQHQTVRTFRQFFEALTSSQIQPTRGQTTQQPIYSLFSTNIGAIPPTQKPTSTLHWR